MNVFFLIQRFQKPSSRYRVLQFLPSLKEAGIVPEVKEVSGKSWQRLRTLIKARKADVVFIQKKLFHSYELRLLKSRGAKLVYDFDDAIMFRHKPVPGRHSFTRHRQFASMMRRSDVVLAGNRFLEQKANEMAPRVVYLPTSIDVHRYSVKKEVKGRSSIVLGWMGSPSTLPYLEEIMPAIRKVAKLYPEIELKVVSSVFPNENGVKLIKKLWKEEEEEQDLHSFDIGLAPLKNDPWCEGKCGLKLLQYMACGIASVSSPYGGQKEIIQEGQNGSMAHDIDSWVEKLSHLIRDTKKRIDFGIQARKTVEDKFSLNAASGIFLKVFDELKN